MERPAFLNVAKVGLLVLGGLYSAAALDHIGEDNGAAVEYGIEGALFTGLGLGITKYQRGREIAQPNLEAVILESKDISPSEILEGEPSIQLVADVEQRLGKA